MPDGNQKEENKNLQPRIAHRIKDPETEGQGTLIGDIRHKLKNISDFGTLDDFLKKNFNKTKAIKTCKGNYESCAIADQSKHLVTKERMGPLGCGC
jgi:hypothetical protein